MTLLHARRSSLKLFLSLCLAMLALMAGPAAQAAGKYGADVRGAQDHPLIKRFTGSWLTGYRSSDWEEISLPTGLRVKDSKMLDKVTLEGKVTRLVYLAPQGKSRLEVYRNYEQALTAAGLERRFTCESNCADLYFAWTRELDIVNGFKWAEGSIPQAGSTSTYSTYSALAPEDGRFLYGSLSRGGSLVHVLLYNSVAANASTDITATTLIIVEPKAMPTGQVSVDAKAMQSGLEADGK
ncbi:MAG: hypothetical protein JWP29_3981, partial [Rhodoferax sp.]|nr:hypothetical protein [Rhodoferax sp.]